MSLKSDDPNYYAHQYNWMGENGQKREIRILDSTLREGEQHPGVSFTKKQRIQIAWMLDSFGVDQIEISPVVSTDHFEATKTIIKQGLKADILAHVRAIKSDVDIAINCGASWIATYMGISDIHLSTKLKITREEAKIRALEVADYINAHGLKARFTMEDASRTDPTFLIEMCKEMNCRGIERISIPDTVGIMCPKGMYNLVKMVYENIDTSKSSLDVHCHNDVGLALANALAGCEAGADQIHTTIDGFGELAGKNGASYLLSLLGLETRQHEGEILARGLKELRMGDILELYLDDRLERKILNDETPKVKAKE